MPKIKFSSSLDLIKQPLTTFKTSQLFENNQYTFLVDPKLMFKEVDYTHYKSVIINDGIGRKYENNSDDFLSSIKALYEQIT